MISENRKDFLLNSLRYHRLEHGWDQGDLAQRVGCSRNTISSIENYIYFPYGYLCAMICKVFQCNFDDIFMLASDALLKDLITIDEFSKIIKSNGRCKIHL